jgi:2-polyprenyl-3-methyl-5-hydroxy-6-metoxy-1,4-benzoquinol methylase
MKEPAKISNPEYSVDQIVARMKAAAARQGQLADLASSGIVATAEFRPNRPAAAPVAGMDINPLVLQPPFQPHSDGRYHVNDLLKYHDRNFIQNAYRAILKRGPDAAGYKGFLESLRSARLNKIDILARLRYSPEGRAKGVEIEGLSTPAMIRRAYRVPVIGYLLNLAVAIARLPLTMRSEQQFEAHTLAQQEMIAEHLNHIGRLLLAQTESLSASLKQSAEQFQQVASRQEAVEQEVLNRFRDQAQHVEAQLTQLTDRFERGSNDLSRQFNSRLDDEAAQRREELSSLVVRMGELASQFREAMRTAQNEFHQRSVQQREQLESTEKKFKLEVDHVLQKQQQVTTELVFQGQRLTSLLEEARKRLPAPLDEAQLQRIAGEADHTLDAFYASFDDEFRGRRDEIKERLKVYLPIIARQAIGSEAMPILDVGCGRGEWLELLREQNLIATGIDSNRVLVEQCRLRGLDVVENDLMSYMHSLARESLGAVTGFHIVEHLPIETLIEFLNETLRVLKLGGVAIFETPNPQNVLVGSCNFYFDPTHRNPLPSLVMKFFLESRGFVGVEVLSLNPSDDTPVASDSELARRFNQYFYGPMDYAVVGWKSTKPATDDGR